MRDAACFFKVGTARERDPPQRYVHEGRNIDIKAHRAPVIKILLIFQPLAGGNAFRIGTKDEQPGTFARRHYRLSPAAHQNGSRSEKRMSVRPASSIIDLISARVNRCSSGVPKRSRLSVRKV